MVRCNGRHSTEEIEGLEPMAKGIVHALFLRGHNQRDLARRAGVAPSMITRWIRGQRPPQDADSQRRILAACRALDVPTAALIRHALNYGGAAARAMEILIDDGAVSDPKHESDVKRLTIQEVCMRPQLIRDATLRHFKIPQDPFGEPDGIADVWTNSPRVREVQEWLMEHALRGERMAALIGDPGCGKTTLVKLVIEDLRARHETRVIWPEITDKRFVTANSLQSAIMSDLTDRPKIYSERELKSRAAVDVMKSVRAQGARLLLVIDEGHDLPLPVLHSLKRMNEARDGFRKLLSILVLAQPEFHHALANFSVREFSLRLNVMDYPGLAKAEPYLRFRLRRCGMTDQAIDSAITADAWAATESKLKLLKRESGESAATPLAAQNLFARALNLAAEAGDKQMGAAHVEHVQDR